ncbi:hypothetical protein COLO4_11691 [Corchorus olitorius]|uniref:non-specific serine/threonine protein kinase n=1 Tax=Corchorus olitorius TaxID=93759 RepID=A0A1R3K3U3_9ROSI|nr:hypothetical protein COLO4_11691 [Corchorus olitorius]
MATRLNMLLLNLQLISTCSVFVLPSAHSVHFQIPSFAPNDNRILYQGDAIPSNGVVEFNDITKNYRVGWASYADHVPLWNSKPGKLSDFTTRFSLRINIPNSTTYGHGFCFFLAPVGSLIPPNSAAGLLGLFNTTNGVSALGQVVFVEFDTYENQWDPSGVGNHVGINNNSLTSSNYTSWNASVHKGDTADVLISYAATTKDLRVSWSYRETNNPGENSSLSYQIDLMKALPERVMVGFSGSIGFGGAREQHILQSWEFNSTLEQESNNSTSRKTKIVIGVLIPVVVLIAVAIMAYMIFQRRKRKTETAANNLTSINDDLERGAGPRRFSYSELVTATNNFSEDRKLGEGGFGAVYRGYLPDLDLVIAVKRISKGSKQGKREYVTEVKTISQLRHRNLVQLIGWCHERSELLLIYEFLPNGSLDSHLFGKRAPLSWAVRGKSEMGLVEWVWGLYGKEELLSAVDKKLNKDVVEKEVEHLMIVGLWCAHPDSGLRPSIRQVIQVLNFEAPKPNLPMKMPVPTYLAPTPSTTSISFRIPSFDSHDKSILYQGDAKPVNGVVEFNDISKNYRVGWATYADYVPLWNSKTGQLSDFTTRFSLSINIRNVSAGYGHGFSFFLAPAGSTMPPNSAGAFLGLFNTTSAVSAPGQVVSVEFDTYEDSWDPKGIGSHVGIDINSLTSANYTAWNASIHNGDTADVLISYNATTKNLRASWSYQNTNDSKEIPSLSYQLDLMEALPEWVTVGFSGSIGLATEQHVLRSWEFNSTLDLEAETKSSTTARKSKIVLGILVPVVVLLTAIIIPYIIFQRRKRAAALNLSSMNDDIEIEAAVAPRGKSEMGLVGWVWDLYGKEELLSAVDEKLNKIVVEKEVEHLMIVGLWCAHPDSDLRPSIKQVIQVLNFEAPKPNLPTKMPVPTYLAATPSTTSISFQIPRFASHDDSILYQGDAKPVNGVIEFNDISKRYRVGWATYANYIPLWNPKTGQLSDFTTRFSFSINIQNVSDDYGHGFSFFLAPVGSLIPPNSGGPLLGLFNTTNGVSALGQVVLVEFDTYRDSLDPRGIGSHVGIDINSLTSVNYTSWNASFHNSDTADVLISYNATTKNLRASWSYQNTNDPQEVSSLSYQIDLMEALPEWVMVGFSGSIGVATEQHILRSWDFSSTLDLEPPETKSRSTATARKTKIVIGTLVPVGVLLTTAILAYIIFWRRKRNTAAESNLMNDDLELGAGPRRFSYGELVSATNNFSQDRKLGEGGFGAVYKGYLPDLDLMIAVKRISKGSKQGKKEYVTEVKTIGQLRHRNLVQLIGWCHERSELLLIYEFMPNGSLDSHLFGKRTPLSWAVSEMGLVEWVWDLYGKEELLSAVDKKLNKEVVEKEVEHLMMVGLWCAHPDSDLRPSIRQVIQVLNFEAPKPNLPTKMPVPTYLAPTPSTTSSEPLLTNSSLDVGR